MALALGQDDTQLLPTVREILIKAKTSWLRNSEVLDLLVNYDTYGLQVAKEPPHAPPGGSLFLFNRRKVRFFRKDGHEWRKKADGKTVRETHEKLKSDNKDALNCYYAHSDVRDALQRRCYWMLAEQGDIVLVHYLSPNASSRVADASLLKCQQSSDIDSVAHSDWDGMSKSALLVECQGSSGMSNQMSGTYTVTTGEPFLEQLSDDRDSVFRQSWKASLSSEAQLDFSSEHPVTGSPSTSYKKTSQAPVMHAQAFQVNSIGPLHLAPTFSGGTVQTGSTVCSSGILRNAASVTSNLDSWDPSLKADDSLRLPVRREQSSSQQSSPGHSKRVREATGPSDSVLVELSSLELKPAVSLTRVNSDTLMVAPSVSGATSGRSRLNQGDESVFTIPSPHAGSSPLLSPFYMAAISATSIMGSEATSDASKGSKEDLGLARSAPVHRSLGAAAFQQSKRPRQGVTVLHDLRQPHLQGAIFPPSSVYPTDPACNLQSSSPALCPTLQIPSSQVNASCWEPQAPTQRNNGASMTRGCEKEAMHCMADQTPWCAKLQAYAGCGDPGHNRRFSNERNLQMGDQMDNLWSAPRVNLKTPRIDSVPPWHSQGISDPESYSICPVHFPMHNFCIPSDVDWTYDLPLL